MACVVVLLQHGTKTQDAVAPRLTSRGREQAARAGAVLARARPTRLVSSPLTRAVESIRPLSIATGLEIIIDDRILERMEYRPEVWESVPQFLDDWRRTTRDRDFVPPSGTSSRIAGARLQSAVLEHAEAGGVVVMATHGGVTVDLLRSLLGDRQIDRRLLEEGMPNGHLTTLVVADGAIDVVGVGLDPQTWTVPPLGQRPSVLELDPEHLGHVE